ncbi:MAG: beta-ketoacyl-[acyl-carrier-protein] synthase family protein [bacterium]
MKHVVITGLGLVSPLGNTVAESLASALAGASGIRRCERYLWDEFGASIPARVAGTVEGLDARHFVPAAYASSYDPAIVYALAAAAEAIADAALDLGDAELRDRAAVVLGVAAPGSHTYHRALHAAFVERKAHELPGRVSLNISGNMPSALVALEHGLRGPNYGIVNACAAGATSITVAADLIRAGRADVALAGGAESCIGLVLLGSMGNARAINPTAEPERASRPFARDRAGLVMAEGAGIVVLEDRDHARARGARIHAELLGDAQTNDAYHVYHPRPDGSDWARTMRMALAAADVAPSEVDVVSAHAASTPHGDLAETRALKSVLGERAYEVPVSATKSMHGHAYGAAGAIETVLALAAGRRGRALPTTNLTQPDPECDLDYVADGARAVRAEVLLKNSFGFGGTNACLVIRIAPF